MIHTVYSNSYEVLRAVLLHNIEALAVGPAKNPSTLFERAFERVPIITPSVGVALDVQRAVARKDAVCAGLDFMTLSTWMGFFSKEPLANVVGNEAEWMIWAILRRTGPGSFREAPGHGRLKNYLKGKTDRDVYALARRISGLFVSYATYRLDWIFSWLGLHAEAMKGVESDENRRREDRALEAHPDWAWQRDLWVELSKNPRWQGRRFLEAFPGTLARIENVRPDERRLTFEDGRSVAMPGALHVFVPFVVPPLMLPILKAYAASGREIWFYLLNPSSEYWFDLVPRRLFAVRGDEHREIGHPILADNGRSTRANIDRLWRFTQPDDRNADTEGSSADEGGPDTIRAIDRTRTTYEAFMARYFRRPQDLEVETDVEMQSYYLEANDPRLLRRIQDSILLLDATRVTHDVKTGEALSELLSADDDSVRFAAAPTAVRELEGLAEWLQTLFESTRNDEEPLRPDDVLVVTPDISALLPLVERVFGSLPAGRRIEWRATGMRAVEADSPGETLLELGRLLTGRVRSEALLAWLSLPLVARRYGFAVEDLSILSDWLKAAGFRFGLSDEHLAAIDPATYGTVKDMTLARAVERLALGYFLPDAAKSPWGDVIPVRGSEADGWVSVVDRPELLEALARAAADLEAFRRRTEGEHEPAVWVEWMTDALTVFFPSDATGLFAPLRTAIVQLAGEMETADSIEPIRVSFELFLSALAGRVEGTASAGKPTHCVTFTSMTALRGLPYKVIALVGLNDDCAFPGTTRREEFDLMGAAPRRGDRDSRVDNRNAFLDLLLAARSRFYVSYVAGTGTAERLPSVVAEELRAWILSLEEDEERLKTLSARLTKRIPLNRYSPDAFLAPSDMRGPGWRSHDASLLAALRAADACEYRADERVFADTGLEIVGEWRREGLPSTLLKAWWAKPATTTLSLCDVRYPKLSETEPLSMFTPSDGLSKWQRKDEALGALLAGETVESIRERWALDGRFGAAGIREWSVEEELDTAESVASRWRAIVSGLERIDDPAVSVKLDSGLAIEHRQGDLYRTPDGELKAVRRAVSEAKTTSGAFFKLLVDHAICRAAGMELKTVVVCPPVAEKKPAKTTRSKPKAPPPGADGLLKMPDFTPEEARALLEALASPLLALERRAAQGADDAPFVFGLDAKAKRIEEVAGGAATRVLWRGEDEGEVLRRRQNEIDALKALAVAGDDPAEATVRLGAFLAAMGLPLGADAADPQPESTN